MKSNTAQLPALATVSCTLDSRCTIDLRIQNSPAQQNKIRENRKVGAAVPHR